MEGNRWSNFCLPEILCDSLQYVVQIVLAVEILGFLNFEVNFVAFLTIIIEKAVFLRYLVFDLMAKHQSCLVCPAARHVFYSVASSP